MDKLAWLFFLSGSVLVSLGLVALFQRVAGVPRSDGWVPLALGESALFSGIARSRDLPGEDWLRWLSVALLFGALIYEWRSRRRRRLGS
jgi:hypothetical protein